MTGRRWVAVTVALVCLCAVALWWVVTGGWVLMLPTLAAALAFAAALEPPVRTLPRELDTYNVVEREVR